MATCLTAMNKGCDPVARLSLCEGDAEGLCDQCCEPQCECSDGSRRDLCEYCAGDSLMPVSQRHKADSLNSTVFSEYGEEKVSISELAVHEHQIDFLIDCWSVSSEYDEEIASDSTFLHANKVKVGGRSRAMSTPWCWKAVSVNGNEIPEQTVAGPALPELEEIDEVDSLMPQGQILDRICEQNVKILGPQMEEQLIGGRTERIVPVPVPQVLVEIADVVRSTPRVVEQLVEVVWMKTVQVARRFPLLQPLFRRLLSRLSKCARSQAKTESASEQWNKDGVWTLAGDSVRG